MGYLGKTDRRRAPAGQDGVNAAGGREVGFGVYRMPDGSLRHGKIGVGTRTRMRIPLEGPRGGKLVAITHSHPGGVAVPSSIDVATAKKLGLPSCIFVPETRETKCFLVRKTRRVHQDSA